ncbi:MAG: hypothetical protein LBM28_02245 [Oscillospiraceae bacterium]|jgi:hypothetical protein|nr:hypothetical protein [Oscillospiraceae bacterium]
MKEEKIFRAIGDIDDELIERAAPEDCAKKKRAPWLRLAVPIAACLLLALTATAAVLWNPRPSAAQNPPETQQNIRVEQGNPGSLGSLPLTSGQPYEPSLSLEEEPNYNACYIAPERWRGLPTQDFVLKEEAGEVVSDRMVFQSLEDLAAYADAFAVVPIVRETAQEGEQMQSAIAEYGWTIGGSLDTAKWDDRTVSTGNRVLIRQQIMGGCVLPYDEPSNLLREGGTYLLPLKFNEAAGVYMVVGDLDVLFELNDEGKIVSHSQYPGLNQYDGKNMQELLDAVVALYAD